MNYTRRIIVSLSLILAGAVMACDHLATSGFAVRPYPVSQSLRDTTENVVRTVTDIGTREGMTAMKSSEDGMRWATCLAKSSLILCGRERDSVYEFRFSEWGRFAASSVQLQQALIDSLRRRYGASRVVRCSWVVRKRDADCLPLRADST